RVPPSLPLMVPRGRRWRMLALLRHRLAKIRCHHACAEEHRWQSGFSPAPRAAFVRWRSWGVGLLGNAVSYNIEWIAALVPSGFCSRRISRSLAVPEFSLERPRESFRRSVTASVFDPVAHLTLPSLV